MFYMKYETQKWVLLNTALKHKQKSTYHFYLFLRFLKQRPIHLIS